MADIIPGVPTPSDPSCSLSYCGRVTAQVTCIKYIMQGTTACIDIQLFDADGDPLNLDDFSKIHAQIFDYMECVIANFWYPEVSTGTKGLTLTILQETTTDNTIENKGMIRMCLGSSCTKISPGDLFVEILLTQNLNSDETSPTIIGIPCLLIGKIMESKIYNNGSNSGCN